MHSLLLKFTKTVLLFLGSATLASADVIFLTGGDPSDGLMLNSNNVVDAFFSPDSGTTAPLTFQGVTFVDWQTSGKVTTGTNDLIGFGTETPSLAGFTNPSTPSAEDTNLLNLVNAGLSFNSGISNGSFDVTIHDLTPNTSYVVDSISSLLDLPPNRTFSVGYNGNSPLPGDTAASIGVGTPGVSGAGTDIFDIQDLVTSDPSGNITISYGSDSNPFFNAIVISEVPEPSTWAMMLAGVGFLGFWLRRRRARVQV